MPFNVAPSIPPTLASGSVAWLTVGLVLLPLLLSLLFRATSGGSRKGLDEGGGSGPVAEISTAFVKEEEDDVNEAPGEDDGVVAFVILEVGLMAVSKPSMIRCRGVSSHGNGVLVS